MFDVRLWLLGFTGALFPARDLPKNSIAKTFFPAKGSGVKARDKILSLESLSPWRAAFRATGRKLVVTNGCFDLLHAGHVTYLEQARNRGDALLIGLNGDDAVRKLKGEGRPINNEQDRAAVLAGLQSVDGVCIFAEPTATRFLT